MTEITVSIPTAEKNGNIALLLGTFIHVSFDVFTDVYPLFGSENSLTQQQRLKVHYTAFNIKSGVKF